MAFFRRWQKRESFLDQNNYLSHAFWLTWCKQKNHLTTNASSFLSCKIICCFYIRWSEGKRRVQHAGKLSLILVCSALKSPIMCCMMIERGFSHQVFFWNKNLKYCFVTNWYKLSVQKWLWMICCGQKAWYLSGESM